MSSTKRSSERITGDLQTDEHRMDYYRTPDMEIKRFLQAFHKDYPGVLDNQLCALDPCAGGDPKNPTMPYPEALKLYHPHYLHTLDIRDDSSAQEKTNYLTWESPNDWDLIITNPPFAFAEAILKKALTEVDPQFGFVILLCRLNFFGGEKRTMTTWNKGMMPERTYVHSKRMCFGVRNKKGQLQTDSIEYMHGVWRPWQTTETILTVLPGGELC